MNPGSNSPTLLCKANATTVLSIRRKKKVQFQGTLQHPVAACNFSFECCIAFLGTNEL
jgi:hypothetical protein